ncbi:MAG: cobalt-precorrin-5B (C(1))-methyltransferase CbiD [Lachnospiraceae bacterium]|nr:cobalt-precorrin-5B (C(1))-methyltransferase CbiD [Lachnospiraceae bacterium]
MRNGYTTGSCAAAAAKAAACMLLDGRERTHISIVTPKGIVYEADLTDIVRHENEVICGVVKDAGDDPDVTGGLKIMARVFFENKEGAGKGRNISIYGGEGVGTVTAPGLDQPVGNAAINSVPRKMIEAAVLEVMNLFDHEGALGVEIFVPGGKAVAEKTFNPRLGIKGGISILGTSGIVEPMSTQAVKDTILTELKQKAALGHRAVAIAPGNYGLAFLKEQLHFDLDAAVKCSNFIGDTLDMIAELGFKKVVLIGHIGKLIKVSGGIMNTHSKEADARIELLMAAAVRSGVSIDYVNQLSECLTTTEALRILEEAGVAEYVMQIVTDRICYHLVKRTGENVESGCIVFAGEEGLLGKSDNAMKILEEIRNAGTSQLQ